MIARLLFILYKQEDHIIPKYYHTILRTIACLSYFIAICILSFTMVDSENINITPIQIIILLFTTLIIPADILDHTGREENILLNNLKYQFISKTSQPRIVYDASRQLDIFTYHNLASSEIVSTMISYNLETVQKINKFKVLKLIKAFNLYDIYYMGENHIDDNSKKLYEIERIKVYNAKIKTTVFKRKAIKTVKMIDFYWKGKDK